jgi:hypothetical protein
MVAFPKKIGTGKGFFGTMEPEMFEETGPGEGGDL